MPTTDTNSHVTWLSFPTRGDIPGPLGHPLPAEPCRCRHHLIHEETCCYCGHLEEETVRRTWQMRAMELRAA